MTSKKWRGENNDNRCHYSRVALAGQVFPGKKQEFDATRDLGGEEEWKHRERRGREGNEERGGYEVGWVASARLVSHEEET